MGKGDVLGHFANPINAFKDTKNLLTHPKRTGQQFGQMFGGNKQGAPAPTPGASAPPMGTTPQAPPSQQPTWAPTGGAMGPSGDMWQNIMSKMGGNTGIAGGMKPRGMMPGNSAFGQSQGGMQNVSQDTQGANPYRNASTGFGNPQTGFGRRGSL